MALEEKEEYRPVYLIELWLPSGLLIVSTREVRKL